MTNTQTQKSAPPVAVEHDWPVVGKLWANQGSNGRLSLSATFASQYKDKQSGDYRESSNIFARDLLKQSRIAAKLYDASLAYEREAYERSRAQTDSSHSGQDSFFETDTPGQDGH